MQHKEATLRERIKAAGAAKKSAILFHQDAAFQRAVDLVENWED